MDKEERLLFIKLIAKSSAEEGSAFNPESFLSNWEVVDKAFAPAKSPTPTQRHVIATERHIEDVCNERDRMARELAAVHEAHAVALRELRREFTVVIEAHRDRLDWFEPHYEGLKRDYDNIKSLNFSYVCMITGGGVLIGAASFLPWDVWKFSSLAAGALATACGLWTQGLVVYKSPPSKERPASGQIVT